MASVGKPIPHDSGKAHATGEAVFLDDVRPATNELFVDFVGSSVARGKIRSVDIEAANKIPGVIAIYTHRDVPHNVFGPVVADEKLLADKDVNYIGEPIVLIAAESHDALKRAKKAVKISIASEKPVLSIVDAIEAKEFLGPRREITRGDVASAFKSATHTLNGTFISGGQDHFYLESQVAIAYPGEDGQVVVHSSTQNPSEIQAVVADVLGIGQHQVICICKRMGGGFGGKETQAAQPAIMATLVATKTRRPARVVFTKDDDMKFTGKRHPYQSNYQVAFDDSGRITAVKIDFYSNGGYSTDLSLAVMERTLLHADNAYFIPNVYLSGQVCKTNLPSNTAFRGFGGPQAVACIENIIEEIAAYLKKDAYDIRVLNCYGIEDRNITPYGQLLDNNLLPDIFAQLANTSDYRKRRTAIDQFNKTSRTHLRGLAMTAVKFGISFTKKFLNQGNALVNLYPDGTIQVSTGGTEMGQGLNTKIRQLVADQFSIPHEQVLVMPTSTEKNNNTSPTAASASTDLNGTAAVRACEQIRHRLADFASSIFASADDGLEKSPQNVVFQDGYIFDSRRPENKVPFAAMVKHARFDRVNLGERGFYATPGVDYNRDTGKGHPFLYYTTGCAVAEIEIDRFTGDLRLERLDLLMDIGKSINPLVDRGQVVGGFVQGIGWCTTEELKYSETGTLLSYSPTTYKIPNIGDIPQAFNIDFIVNESNTRNVAASKAVGEPPLLLGICAWAAVKNALSYIAKSPAKLNLPATGEQILMRLTELTKREKPKRQPPKTISTGAAPNSVTVARAPLQE